MRSGRVSSGGFAVLIPLAFASEMVRHLGDQDHVLATPALVDKLLFEDTDSTLFDEKDNDHGMCTTI